MPTTPVNRHPFSPGISRRDFLTACSAIGFTASLGEWAFALSPAEVSKAESPWLKDNFAPVTEELTSVPLTVQGAIPASLKGSFVRTGPNPVFPPTPYHWFDGDGMLHEVSFDGSVATYSNRYVQTEGFLKEKAAGKSLYGGLLAGPPFKNAANISIVQHHGKVLATWEGGSPTEIEAGSLATKGLYDFSKQWPWAMTAHPKCDPASGNLYVFGYGVTAPYVRYGVVNPEGKLVHTAEINIPRAIMMHDFAITENYALFMDLPVVFSKFGIGYRPQFGARIGIVPKLGSSKDVRWFEIEPCWVYHILNAHEENDVVVLRAHRRAGWPTGSASLYEWRFNLTSGAVTQTEVNAIASEFPVINPLYTGRNHRYGYAGREGGLHMDAILKYDFELNTHSVYEFGPRKGAGEAIFVSDKARSGEDGGWLMSFVYGDEKNSSDLVIINAETMKHVATLELPRRLPYGFHGAWIE